MWTFHTAYAHYSRCYALLYGNRYADGAFTSEVSRLCPRQYLYDNLTDHVIVGDDALDFSAIHWDLFISNANVLRNHPALRELGSVAEYADGLFVIASPGR